MKPFGCMPTVRTPEAPQYTADAFIDARLDAKSEVVTKRTLANSAEGDETKEQTA